MREVMRPGILSKPGEASWTRCNSPEVQPVSSLLPELETDVWTPVG